MNICKGTHTIIQYMQGYARVRVHICKGTHTIIARARIQICRGTQTINARARIQICRGTHTINARARIQICRGTHTIYNICKGTHTTARKTFRHSYVTSGISHFALSLITLFQMHTHTHSHTHTTHTQNTHTFNTHLLTHLKRQKLFRGNRCILRPPHGVKQSNQPLRTALALIAGV